MGCKNGMDSYEKIMGRSRQTCHDSFFSHGSQSIVQRYEPPFVHIFVHTCMLQMHRPVIYSWKTENAGDEPQRSHNPHKQTRTCSRDGTTHPIVASFSLSLSTSLRTSSYRPYSVSSIAA